MKFRHLIRRINDALIWIEYSIFHRKMWKYVLTPGLKPHYHDPSTRMLYAVMAVLCEFVEEETMETLKWRANDPEAESHEPQVYKDIIEVYEWWTKGRAELNEQVNVAFRKWSEARLVKWEKVEEGGMTLHKMVTTLAPGFTEEQYQAIDDEAEHLSNLQDRIEAEMLTLAVKHYRYMWT